METGRKTPQGKESPPNKSYPNPIDPLFQRNMSRRQFLFLTGIGVSQSLLPWSRLPIARNPAQNKETRPPIPENWYPPRGAIISNQWIIEFVQQRVEKRLRRLERFSRWIKVTPKRESILKKVKDEIRQVLINDLFGGDTYITPPPKPTESAPWTLSPEKINFHLVNEFLPNNYRIAQPKEIKEMLGEEGERLYNWLIGRYITLYYHPEKIMLDPTVEEMEALINELSQVSGIPTEVLYALCFIENLCRGQYSGLHETHVAAHEDGPAAVFPPKYSQEVTCSQNSEPCMSVPLKRGIPPQVARIMILPLRETPNEEIPLILTPVPLTIERTDAASSMAFGLLLFLARLKMIDGPSSHPLLRKLREDIKGYLLKKDEAIASKADELSLHTLSYLLYHYSPIDFINRVAQLHNQNPKQNLMEALAQDMWEVGVWVDKLAVWLTTAPPWESSKYKVEVAGKTYYDYPVVKIQRWLAKLSPDKVATLNNAAKVLSTLSWGNSEGMSDFIEALKILQDREILLIISEMQGDKVAKRFKHLINLITSNPENIRKYWPLLLSAGSILWVGIFSVIYDLLRFYPPNKIFVLSSDPRNPDDYHIVDPFYYLRFREWLEDEEEIEQLLNSPEKLANLWDRLNMFIEELQPLLANEELIERIIESVQRKNSYTPEQWKKLLEEILNTVQATRTKDGKNILEKLSEIADFQVEPAAESLSKEKAEKRLFNELIYILYEIITNVEEDYLEPSRIINCFLCVSNIVRLLIHPEKLPPSPWEEKWRKI